MYCMVFALLRRYRPPLSTLNPSNRRSNGNQKVPGLIPKELIVYVAQPANIVEASAMSARSELQH